MPAALSYAASFLVNFAFLLSTLKLNFLLLCVCSRLSWHSFVSGPLPKYDLNFKQLDFHFHLRYKYQSNYQLKNITCSMFWYQVEEEGFNGVLFASIQPTTTVKQSPQPDSYTAFHANNGMEPIFLFLWQIHVCVHNS